MISMLLCSWMSAISSNLCPLPVWDVQREGEGNQGWKPLNPQWRKNSRYLGNVTVFMWFNLNRMHMASLG